MEKEVTLQLDISDIVGCYDIVDVYGGDFTSKSLEHLVAEVLSSTILGLREDNLIPSYNSIDELIKRLGEVAEGQPIREQRPPPIKSDGTLQSIIEEAKTTQPSSEKVQIENKELQVESPQLKELQSGETEKAVNLKEPEFPETNIPFKNLPEADPLVQEVRGDPQLELLLSDLYSTVPRGLWGSDRARRMWNLVLAQEKSQGASTNSDNP